MIKKVPQSRPSCSKGSSPLNFPGLSVQKWLLFNLQDMLITSNNLALKISMSMISQHIPRQKHHNSCFNCPKIFLLHFDFKSYPPRSSFKEGYEARCCRTIGQRKFTYRGTRLWNNLETMLNFQTLLKFLGKELLTYFSLNL